MQRLLWSFFTLLMLLYLPSLIVWLLIVRVRENGTERFHATWKWLEDTLAYPLIFSLASDPAWGWLEDGAPVAATFSFLLLVGLWAIVIALPFVVIAGWWRWVSTMIMGRREGTGPGYADDYAGTPVLVPGRDSSSPLAAFYIVTLPLALLWLAIKRIGQVLIRAQRTIVGGTLVAFVLTALLLTLVMAFKFSATTADNGLDTVEFIRTLWRGWLNDLHVPEIFSETWRWNYAEVRSIARSSDPSAWAEYTDQWYRQSAIRTVMWLTAVRYGLTVATVYLVCRLVRKLF